MVAKKDYKQKNHDRLTDIPNLHVLKLMQSLKSRGYIRETFNWQYYYWYLTAEGVEYLQEYLHLPSDIVPNTHKSQGRQRGGGMGYQGGHDNYQSGKEGTVGHDFRPSFAGEGTQGGFGRGQM